MSIIKTEVIASVILMLIDVLIITDQVIRETFELQWPL